MPGANGDLTKAIITAIMSRGAMGESQIQENIQRNTHTAGMVPFVQAGLFVLSVAGLALAGYLLSLPAAVLLDRAELGAPDILLLASLVGLLSFATYRLLRTLTSRYEPLVAIVLQITLTTVIAGSVLAAVPGIRVALSKSEWAMYGAGVGILAASLALGLRMAIDLLDPFGRSSPAERQLLPALIRMLEFEEQPESTPAGDWVRVRSANELRALLSRAQPEPGTVPAPAAEFVDFVIEARARGLQRSDWLPAFGRRVRLPSTNLEVTRAVYESMIDQAVNWGFIRRARRRGDPHIWLVNPNQALRTLGEGIYGGKP